MLLLLGDAGVAQLQLVGPPRTADFVRSLSRHFVQPRTQIIVSGANLRGGSDYRCEIGASLIPASFDASNDTVMCTTPAGLPAGTWPFSARLNGQESAPSGALTFHVSSHPVVHSISPASGPLCMNLKRRESTCRDLDR